MKDVSVKRKEQKMSEEDKKESAMVQEFNAYEVVVLASGDVQAVGRPLVQLHPVVSPTLIMIQFGRPKVRSHSKQTCQRLSIKQSSPSQTQKITVYILYDNFHRDKSKFNSRKSHDQIKFRECLKQFVSKHFFFPFFNHRLQG
jgi:hypothetical protein